MNIYEKIQLVKEELMKSELKKSGENKFAGFKYFELADFIPKIIELCNKHKLYTGISFTQDLAELTIVNIDKSEEILKYTSPMEELELKGCNKVQALGGTETYQRRYLYMSAFDIVESDMFDAQSGTENNSEEKITDKQLKVISYYYKDENLEKLLLANNIDKIEDLPKTKATEIIKKLNEKKENN
jgi:hypothetical protein